MKKSICFFAVMLVCLIGGSITADSAAHAQEQVIVGL